MSVEWIDGALSDVCHVYQPETLSQKQLVAGDCPVYGANGQIGWHNEFNHEAPQLLLGCRGSCGQVHLSRAKPWVNGNAMVVQPKDGVIDRSFLAYALRGGVEVGRAVTGAAQPQITRTSLMPIPIFYPKSMFEQQRIVGILDEAFSGIATAKANAEKNVQNARALYNSHLETVFLQGGGSWIEHRLDELTQPDTPITYGVVKPGNEGAIRFVRGGDLVQGKVRVSALRTITRSVSDQYRRTLLRGGELLICLVGQPGQVAVAPMELAGANIARQVGLIRLKPSMSAEFVRYFLQSPPGKKVLGARESGSVQQVINLGELRHLSVPHPHLDEQNDVVTKLDAFEAETQRLESLYQRKLAALDALKQSLLHQAFSGRL